MKVQSQLVILVSLVCTLFAPKNVIALDKAMKQILDQHFEKENVNGRLVDNKRKIEMKNCFALFERFPTLLKDEVQDLSTTNNNEGHDNKGRI